MNKIQRFLKNLLSNAIFYISLFICSIMISSKQGYSANFGVFSLCISLFAAYCTHWLLHNEVFLQKVRHIPIISTIFAFHNDHHHNSLINKKPINIFLEFIGNTITFGGGGAVFFKILRYLLNIKTQFIDESILLMLGLSYASAHMINMNIIEEKNHTLHHKDIHKNYWPYEFDILFNTMYDDKTIATYNNWSINVILITIIIIKYKIFF